MQTTPHRHYHSLTTTHTSTHHHSLPLHTTPSPLTPLPPLPSLHNTQSVRDLKDDAEEGSRAGRHIIRACLARMRRRKSAYTGG